MERRGCIRGKNPWGHQQASLPWPGYLDTDLGQQTEPLSEVKESLAMSPINSMPPSLYLLSASIYIFMLFFMIQFCSINSIVFCSTNSIVFVLLVWSMCKLKNLLFP